MFNNSDVRYTSTNAGDKFRGSLDWSGFKRSNLEGGVHIPLAFYWAGHFTPHKETNIVSNYDFLSTMADMLGVSITSQKDGISYLPLLEERSIYLADSSLLGTYPQTDSAVAYYGGNKITRETSILMSFSF